MCPNENHKQKKVKRKSIMNHQTLGVIMGLNIDLSNNNKK
jgi:phosphotransferase system HPr-like phosphotransfer protein